MKLKRKESNGKIKSHFIIFGSLLLFIGGCLLIAFPYFDYCHDKEEEKVKIKKFIDKNSEIANSFSSEKTIQTEPLQQEDFLAVIEIPKIELRKGLVDRNSPNNDVDKNICILKETTFPDEKENSHILLAAHSGTGKIAYFKNLSKLEQKDRINFYYKGTKYIYEVSDMYEIEKTGMATIRYTNGSDITLITCVYGTNKQIVFVAKLKKEENY